LKERLNNLFNYYSYLMLNLEESPFLLKFINYFPYILVIFFICYEWKTYSSNQLLRILVLISSLLLIIYQYRKTHIKNKKSLSILRARVDAFEYNSIMMDSMRKEIELVKESLFTLSSDMKRIQSLVSGATDGLSKSFTALHENSRRQRIIVDSLMEGLGGDSDKKSCFYGFIREIEELVGFYSNSIIESSKENIKLVHKLDDIMEDVNNIDNLLEGIKEISSQSNLLALNAKIEAARAGEMGRGFAIVATEVGNLSSSSDKFSEKIHDVVSGAVKGIEEASDVIKEIAENDKILILRSNERVRIMLRTIADIKDDTTDGLAGISVVNKSVDENVGCAVTYLQFEDMVAQLSQSIINRFSVTNEVIDLISKNIYNNEYENESSVFDAVSAVRSRINGLFDSCSQQNVKQVNMGSGGVELF